MEARPKPRRETKKEIQLGVANALAVAYIAKTPREKAEMDKWKIPGYCTVPEAAKRLDLDISMVRRYCQLGRITAAKMGGAWLIWEEDLETFERRPPGNPNWGRDDSATTEGR